MIKWEEKGFEELSADELYEIFKIRAEIFVLEQEIAYVDPDNTKTKKSLYT
jgi:Predicted acyltransferase